MKEKHDNNEFLTIVTEGVNDLKKGQRNIESKLDHVGIAFQMMNEQIKQLENGQTNAIKQVMNNLNNLQNSQIESKKIKTESNTIQDKLFDHEIIKNYKNNDNIIIKIKLLNF